MPNFFPQDASELNMFSHDAGQSTAIMTLDALITA
jgi:hypothetical protein